MPAKIITYAASMADDAPEHLRCLARIIMPDGALGTVVCHAATKSQAREKMQAWWDAEMERQRRRREAEESRREAMRRAREARKPSEPTETAA